MSTKKKILVVEDEDSIRSFIVINLSRAGYEVCEAGSGEDALTVLENEAGIGVALLDLMLQTSARQLLPLHGPHPKQSKLYRLYLKQL